MGQKSSSSNMSDSFCNLIVLIFLKKGNWHYRLKDFIMNVVGWKFLNYYSITMGFTEDLKELNQQSE